MLALFSLEGMERCVHFADVYIENEGVICFPCLSQITKTFCYTEISAWRGKRIAVYHRKRRPQRVRRTVTSSLGMHLLTRGKHLGISETSQLLGICIQVL